jgi:radical SAM superfamily enzyme YgiQ (UPF0313 family)
MQAIIRPPSEANSFILLAMLGCSNNTCTFCPSYKKRKFEFRNVNEVLKEFDNEYHNEERIFIADGDAISISQKDLVELLKYIKDNYPNVERVSSYITAKSALGKSLDELKQLKELGLELVYLGLESGDDSVLNDVKKNMTTEDMVKAAKRIKDAGIKLSVTVLLGIGGKEKSKQHAKATAKILNKMQPDYVGALTLMVVPGTEFCEKVKKGEITELVNYEYLQELYFIIEDLELEYCIFRSNHASNYASIGGCLPENKEEMLKQLEEILENKKSLKPEMFRGL